MATRRELLDEMDGHLGEVRSALNDVAQRIASHTQEIGVAQQGRRQGVWEHTVRLLPGLAPATLQAIAMMLPGSVTVEGVEAMRARAQATARTEMDHLARRFDPARYDANRVRLEINLATARENLASDQSTLERMNSIPGLEVLMASGYGTEGYPHHWWSIQFYRDWEASDQAVEQAQAADWETLRRTYADVMGLVTGHAQEITRLEAELRDLDTNRKTWNELAAVASDPDAWVLEDLRVKLASWLDAQAPGTVPVPGVAAQDARIAALQQALTSLHTTQAGLYRALSTLEQTRARIARTRVGDVPDGFVGALQQYRMRSGGYGGVVAYPAYEVDAMNNFYTGVLWEQMNDYFVPQAAYDQGYADGSSSATGEWSGERSGQWSGVDTSIQS